VQENGFADEDIGGDALSDSEFERLDVTLFFFQARWRDDPIMVHTAEHGGDSQCVHFIFVDFITRDTIRPFKPLARYGFTSRSLYLARNNVSNGGGTSHFLIGDATIDNDTRQLLARARITMRMRTMQYVVKGSRLPRLILDPTNVLMGYVV
jgi:hypothetical protein